MFIHLTPCRHPQAQLQKTINMNTVLESGPDAAYIKSQLGLGWTTGTGPLKEYAFAMFMLRHRVLDILIWLNRGCHPAETSIRRSKFPDTKGIVSSFNMSSYTTQTLWCQSRFDSLGRNWVKIIEEALDWMKVRIDLENQPLALELSLDSSAVRSPLVNHLRSYLRRKATQDLDSIYLNIDLAVMYLSHLLEVRTRIFLFFDLT